MNKCSMDERFWCYVDVGDENSCWNWIGCADEDGYGVFWVGGKKRMKRAHRVSFELYFGAIPAGMFVCHRCDNSACVNPAHLFLGTHRDNMRDMVQRGRSYHPECFVGHRGIEHPGAKLNSEQLELIRTSNLIQSELAELFGVSQQTISRVKRHEYCIG